MNSKFKKALGNLSYTITSNFISLAISTIVVLVVPKLIGIEDYGYWQLYLFYSSYVGFLNFGWNDGIYLRYGGEDYNKLDKRLFFSQFYMVVLFQILIGIIIYLISRLNYDGGKSFIFQMTAIGMVIFNVRSILLFTLQATNKIKQYAIITIVGKIIYCILITLFLVVGIRNYKLMIIADLFGKLISLIYSIYICRDIVLQKITQFYFSIEETIRNINAGIKLMFANIASMLIIGVVRFGIEYSWDVATFGKVSLTLSISNLMMVFINAIGIVIFPLLKRENIKKLPQIYKTIRDILMVILYSFLIFYYPLTLIISYWLPKYVDSVSYMALVFPIFVYEGKMALLINTYMKILRKEKLLLKVNLITLLFSVILTVINVGLFKNLNLAIGSIVLLLAFKSIYSEFLLLKFIEKSIKLDILLESILTASFILSSWFIKSWISTIIYIVIYLVYLIIKRSDTYNSIIVVKSMITNTEK